MKIIFLISYEQSNDSLSVYRDTSYAEYSSPREHSYERYTIGARIGSVILYDDRNKTIIGHETNLSNLFPATEKFIKEAIYKVKGTHNYLSYGPKIEISGGVDGYVSSYICERNLFEREGTISVRARGRILFQFDSSKGKFDGRDTHGRSSFYKERCIQNLFINDVFILKEGGIIEKLWFVGHY